MPRHSGNTNLTLHQDASYLDLPIQQDKGPFIREYLARLKQTIDRALAQYRRVFAFRVDLRLPLGQPLPDEACTNEIMSRFLASFKAKIAHNRRRALAVNKYAHECDVRYVWAREVGECGRPHYHLVILLNNDAYCTLGQFTSQHNNIFHRLEEAWASALGLPVSTSSGLVAIPANPTYPLQRGDQQSIDALFYRASYLCKSATKEYGNGLHGFGGSRR